MVFLGLRAWALDNQESDFSRFVFKYKRDIENFIMAGFGGGWDMCDIIVVDPVDPIPSWEIPHLMGNVKMLNTLDIGNTMGHSHCLLLWAQARDNATLKALIKFGWSTIQHKRVGMMLSLSSNIALDKATNTTNLPFLIAAQLESGREQFMCPVLGSYQPQIQSSICDKNLTDYRGKTIRVGFSIAFRPYGFMTEIGVPDGVDKRFLEVLRSKMDFNIKIAGISWLASHGFKLVPS